MFNSTFYTSHEKKYSPKSSHPNLITSCNYRYSFIGIDARIEARPSEIRCSGDFRASNSEFPNADTGIVAFRRISKGLSLRNQCFHFSFKAFNSFSLLFSSFLVFGSMTCFSYFSINSIPFKRIDSSCVSLLKR